MSEPITFGKQLARTAASGYDDAQQLRLSTMNRVRDVVYRKREGIPFDEVQEEKEEIKFESEYDDDELPKLVDELENDGKLTTDERDYLDEMLAVAQNASQVEEQFEDLMRVATTEPIYTEWLEHVYGVSHVLTAKLIHKFGYCETFDRVSHVWSYSKLAPGQKRQRGEKANFDPEARKLLWIVADRIIMQGDRSHYKKEFYDPYKAEQEERMKHSSCKHCGEPTSEHRSHHGCPEFERKKEQDIEYHENKILEAENSINENSSEDFIEFIEEEVADQRKAIERINDKKFTLDEFDMPARFPEEATPAWNQAHAHERAKRYLSKKFIKHYWYIARNIKGLPTPDEYILVHGDEEEHQKIINSFENPAYAKRILATE